MAENTPRRTQGKQPITRHPLFPATVALWFGALFGLGGLAVRPGLVESLVVAARIDAIIPAAAPPLGVTFRILFALALAAFGGTLGAFVGRAFARPKSAQPARRRGAGAGFGHGEIDGDAAPPVAAAADRDGGGGSVRRRLLGLGAEAAPAGAPGHASLSGGAPQILNVADFDFALPSSSPDAAQDEADPATAEPLAEATSATLDLSGFSDAPVADAGAFGVPGWDAPLSDEPAAFVAPKPIDKPFDKPFDPPAGWAMPDAGHGDDEAAPDEAMPEAIEAPVIDVPATDEAATDEPLVLALEDAGDPAMTELSGTDCADAVDAPQAEAAPSDAAPVATGPHADLIARLSAALERRRNADRAAQEAAIAAAVAAALAARDAEPVVLPVLPDAAGDEAVAERAETPEVADLPPIEADPVADAIAAETPHESAAPAAPVALPASLRGISLDDFDHIDDDEWMQGILPPRQIAMAAPAGEDAGAEAVETVPDTAVDGTDGADAPENAAVPHGDGTDGADAGPDAPAGAPMADAAPETASPAAEDEVLAAGYSSLLSLTRAAPEPASVVRVEEPEAGPADGTAIVVFPGQEGAAVAGFSRRFDPPPFGELSAPAPRLDSAPLDDFAPEQPAPAAAPVPPAALAPLAATSRRFDAPAPSGAPFQAPAMAPESNDPAETERALRAALATLQRMSGAA